MSEKSYRIFLWEMIKSAAYTADTLEKKEKFRYFMVEIVIDLIPYKEVAEEMKARMKDIDIDYYINNLTPMDYVIALKNDYRANKNIKIKPEEFGPPYWRVILHGAACATTKEKLSKFRYFVLVILSFIIPCLLCSQHWLENLKNGPNIDNSMGNNIELLRWVYEMKMIVDMNVKDDYRVPPFQEIINRYLI